MTNHFTSQNFSFFAAGCLVATLFVGGAAQAITDTVFKYSTPKNGYLQIPNGAFQVGKSSTPYVSGNLALRADANVETCFQAPVNLPAGAKMMALAIFYRKSNGTGFFVHMLRKKMSDISVAFVVPTQQLADTALAYKSANFQIADATLQTVDNQHYFYVVQVCMDEKTNLFHGVRIAYTYTNPGD